MCMESMGANSGETWSTGSALKPGAAHGAWSLGSAPEHGDAHGAWSTESVMGLGSALDHRIGPEASDRSWCMVH